MAKKVIWALRGLFAVVAVGFFATAAHGPFGDVLGSVRSDANAAAVFFVQSISVDQLRLAYSGRASRDPITSTPTQTAPAKIRILIVPGHEPESGGTEYKDYTERDIVADIAEDLAALLRANPHYDVIVTRDKTGWDPLLSEYFNTHAADIAAFRTQQEDLMAGYEEQGKIVQADPTEQVGHQAAADDVALRLYGINKWASENHVDITLHLHINDYAGRRSSTEYTGFAIYVPDHQYSNAAASKSVGEAIAARLNRYHATSTLPEESAGVIEDQQLIAIGSNNSADSAAALIEYAYIYEKQLQDPALRAAAEKDYAYETYLGLQDFFKDPPTDSYGTNLLPTFLTMTPTPKSMSSDLYALQSALHYVGLYPAPGTAFSSCPISGYFGPCTEGALRAFEETSSIPQTGLLDAATLSALRAPLAGTVSFSLPTMR